MKKFNIIVSLVFLLLSSPAMSGVEGNGALLLPTDAMDLSLAGGIMSENPLGSSSYNPSLITMGNNKYFFRASYFSGIFEGTDVEDIRIGANVFAGLSIMINARIFNFPQLVATDELGQIVDSEYGMGHDSIMRFALAYDIGAGFKAGFEIANYTYQMIELNLDSYSQDVTFPSIGASWTRGNYAAGLSLNYIKAMYGGDELMVEPFTVIFQAGGKFLDDKLNVNAMIGSILNREQDNMKIALGVEYRFIDELGIRLGFGGHSELLSGLSSGINARYKGVSLDYTFTAAKETMLHHISLGYGFGMKKEVEKVDKPGKPKKKKSKKVKKSQKEEPQEKVVKVQKPEEKLLVAVLDFEGKNMAKEDAAIITDFISQEMLNSGYFQVLERGAINNIMQEVNFQQSGCTSAECAVKIGKILAVKKMVVGSVSKLGKKFFITVRMVDVETSQIDMATSVGANVPLEELPSHVNRLVEKMIEKQFGQ